MLSFLVGWIIASLGIKIYLTVKKYDFKINNDIIAIVLSFIIIGFLNIIQLVLNLILKLFIK